MNAPDHTKYRDDQDRMRLIVIDLTPVLPGGENGGAKLMTIELIRHLSQLAAEYEFVLLTSDRSHDELAMLDARNVRRQCVSWSKPPGEAAEEAFADRLKSRLRTWADANLPGAIKARLSRTLQTVKRELSNVTGKGLLREMNADLLFCPFTAPFYFDPTVPVVSVVYDLQHRYYPHFFTTEDRYHRDRNFKDTCRLVNRLVTISDFVRGTVLEDGSVAPERVVTAYIRLSHRLANTSRRKIARLLQRIDVRAEQFIFYPANFWSHKNHIMLLTAFGMYRARHPHSSLKLVCTGAPGPRLDDMQEAVRKMQMESWIVFPGYISNEEFSGLLTSCRAVIFPSLYEGFGMPVLEAMAFGKPVLCSNVTSLPEIAGDAALLFDPRKPVEIMDAIARIENEPGLIKHLVAQGHARVKTFGGGHEMASQYLDIFREVMAAPCHFTLGLHSVYPDKWAGDRFTITFDPSEAKRELQMKLQCPPWSPIEATNLMAMRSGSELEGTYVLNRAKVNIISHPLPNEGGYIEFLISEVFQPKAIGMGKDARMLGSRFVACLVVSDTETVDLLEKRIDP